MAFTYKQLFSLVIFKSSYFEKLQVGTASKIAKLQAENDRLTNIDNQSKEELLKRINNLQLMIQEDRYSHSLELNKKDEIIKLEQSENRRLSLSLKSGNLLIKELWEIISKYDMKSSRANLKSLLSCQDELKDCNEKVEKVKVVVKQVKKVEKVITPVNTEIKESPLYTRLLDTHA